MIYLVDPFKRGAAIRVEAPRAWTFLHLVVVVVSPMGIPKNPHKSINDTKLFLKIVFLGIFGDSVFYLKLQIRFIVTWNEK